MYATERDCQMAGGVGYQPMAPGISIPAGTHLEVLDEDVSNFMCLEVEYGGHRGWVVFEPGIVYAPRHL